MLPRGESRKIGKIFESTQASAVSILAILACKQVERINSLVALQIL